MSGDRRGRATPPQPRDTGEAPRTDVFVRVVDGRYRLLERLAEGPTGVVYRAEDVLLERVTVIKSLGVGGDEHAPSIARFNQEARALARIRHGNVAQIYAFGVHDGAPFIAMEYVEGRSLAALIEAHAARGETIELDCALRIVRGVAAGLGAVHARGIVHRDVKPSNILIEAATGRAVLIDFGVADLERTSNPKLTARGVPSYVAPEQVFASQQRLTKRADVYAFACTVFELLTGRTVFAGEMHEVLRAHLTASPPPISSFVPRLRPFDDAVRRAMSKAPGDRHATCEDLASELDAAATIVRGIEPVRAIVQTRAEPLRRRLVRFVEDAVAEIARPVTVECVSTHEEAVSALASRPAEVVVLDTNASGGEALAAARVIRARSADTQILVLASDWDCEDVSLAALGVRRLPKPINVHLAHAFFGAAAAMIASREP